MQGIAEFIGIECNPPMLKPVHLGEKLRQEMDRLQLKPARVAELFGVKPPSVYDWIAFGRIHKKHYPMLIEVFGRPISWWLDVPELPTLTASEPPAEMQDEPTRRRHQALVELFDWLPTDEQDDLISSLEAKKQRIEAVIERREQKKRYNAG